MVTAVPDITTHTLTKNDSFLVVASDGLGDDLAGADIAKLVQDTVGSAAAEGPMVAAVEGLCESAAKSAKRQHDDITVVLAKLNK
mmetsp:Transcript_54094/g.127763  ORF Transcript_54094/g.127763 Transcript_54094/m.127763 type:complete len:85 (-) Transcript_54094:1474-1728(-)